MEKQFSFKSDELVSQLKKCRENGITELTVHDSSIACDKARLINFLKAVQKDAPELFVSIKISPRTLDAEIVRMLSVLNCSVEMDFELSEKGFDKKFYAKKCALLNQAGLVFGVRLYYASGGSDSLKLFKERLDFTLSQYPNHIDFPQTEKDDSSDSGGAADGASVAGVSAAGSSTSGSSTVVTGTFSAQDIRFARDIAFACRTFYSAGRAVPWFNSVLAALKIQGSAFFADFAEWQRVNNCDFKSGYVPETESHKNIEKMQVLFLDMKLEEKRKGQFLAAVNDMVRLNGAFSRLVAEGEESVFETEYSPDDLLSPESMDIASFVNDVCMEHSSVSVFLNADGEPDYKIL